MSNRSYWRWDLIVEANGRRWPVQGNGDGPPQATEQKMREAVQGGLDRQFPNGYTIISFDMYRTG